MSPQPNRDMYATIHPARDAANLSQLTTDGRSRVSNFWIPTAGQGKIVDPATGKEDSHDKLLRAAFIRQSHSGLYHFLPLGNRVQAKLEQLVDKHMNSVGACKVSLSNLSSIELWEKSGRWNADRTEFFKLNDRKESGYLLAPTHEEEITQLVADAVHSYKDLPLRLYQVGKKYRDELRPRGGLLRMREFVMKDLYTFDNDRTSAVETYENVRKAYDNFFSEFKLPYIVAKADSGSIGGEFSHEYHYASVKGEDEVHSCGSCDHIVNGELLSQQDSPACPSCGSGTLTTQKTIELGHTFFLGTKYSEPLNARAMQATSTNTKKHVAEKTSENPGTAIEMGCYGIGISRLIATTADLLADDKGLNWPKAIAPFTVAIIPKAGFEDDALVLHDLLGTLPAQTCVDPIIDDRATKSLAWKMNDADLIGYPVLVVLGRSWQQDRKAEVQCRQLGVKQEVDMVDIISFTRDLLTKL